MSCNNNSKIEGISLHILQPMDLLRSATSRQKLAMLRQRQNRRCVGMLHTPICVATPLQHAQIGDTNRRVTVA